MKPKKFITIQYYGDPTKIIDDHESEPEFLTEICEREFEDIFEAVKFLSECEDPITHVEEIIPTKRRFKYILQEKRIRTYHIVVKDIDEKFTNEDEHW